MRIRNLQKRSNGVFYFRTFIPADLVPRFGRKELTRSLETRNRVEGEFLASILRLKVRALFDMALQNPNLSQTELQDLAKRYFDWHLAKAEADRLSRRIKDGELPHVLQQYDENIEDLDRWIAKNQLSQAVPALSALLEREGLSLAPESGEFQKLASYVLRAMRESERIERERASGNFDAAPTDPLFNAPAASVNHTSVPGASPPFSELGSRWLSERKAIWADKTVVKHTSNINVWQALIGRDKPVATITKADVRTARDELRKLPRNWTQKFPGKSITDILPSVSPADGPLIGPGTVNAYLMTLSSFFGWAEKEGYVTGNPVSNLQIDDPVKARDKRDPFKTEHLVKIFNAPVYTGMKSDYKWKEPGSFFKRDHRFWIPLIGLLSGMRLGEIANLTKEDVCNESGIVVFDIKEAKTESGIRKVPVHSKLIEIGLVDFVANTADGAKLFPGTSDAAFSKVFARLLDHLGIKDSKLTFHSFRHTFIDGLRSAKIEQPIIQAVVGQSTGNVTSQYGAGYSVSVLRDAVENVVFPGFDLGCLPL